MPFWTSPKVVSAYSVLFIFLLQESTVERPHEQGRISYSATNRSHRNQEKALLLTFAAGQKYVDWRTEPRRFAFALKKEKEQQINYLLLSFSIIEIRLSVDSLIRQRCRCICNAYNETTLGFVSSLPGPRIFVRLSRQCCQIEHDRDQSDHEFLTRSNLH